MLVSEVSVSSGCVAANYSATAAPAAPEKAVTKEEF